MSDFDKFEKNLLQGIPAEKIKVVHVKRCSPPFGQPGDVYIGRASYGFPNSKWGNPFPLKNESERMDVINKYEKYLFESGLINDIGELSNAKRLGCWCAPKPCHGDVLAKYINMYNKNILRKKKTHNESKIKKCKCKK
ncbi:MAG: hypothetical protein A3K77_01380 [Euryarchaeota archaeon RBG_13_31_8]|nr:MAG: hypothetical protein A3K77_01380 [Euryarchaeota archaeon RBG_13_31_8]